MQLREIRKERNLTLDHVAKLTDVDSTTIGRIERGVQNPRYSTAVSLAKAYDLSVIEILSMCPNYSQ